MEVRGVAVVTGAARGIGAAIARRIAEAGARVVLTDTARDRLDETAEELRAAGLDVHARVVDATEVEQVEALVEASASLGPLAGWVNNAGSIHRAPLLELTVDDWERMLRINARSCFVGTVSAARHMMAAGTGSIVNLASISSVVSLPNTAHYGAAKGAVASFTRHAALELGPLGIRVNALAPGTILTPMTEDRLASEEQRSRTIARIPLGRVGEPRDVAGLATFLLTDEAAFVNGALIPVDGGWLAG